jgi:hypothetical protein
VYGLSSNPIDLTLKKKKERKNKKRRIGKISPW